MFSSEILYQLGGLSLNELPVLNMDMDVLEQWPEKLLCLRKYSHPLIFLFLAPALFKFLHGSMESCCFWIAQGSRMVRWHWWYYCFLLKFPLGWCQSPWDCVHKSNMTRLLTHWEGQLISKYILKWPRVYCGNTRFWVWGHNSISPCVYHSWCHVEYLDPILSNWDS